MSSKDPLDIGSVIIGELPSSGNESGKVPVGRGDSPALTARGLDDHANAFGSAATVIQIGQTKPGSIETTGDHDWFQFRARTNGPILIEVIPLDGKPTPYARFHWDNKTLITQDTGGGSGGIATIRYKNAEAGRNYFLDVSGAAGTKGSYLVRVTQPSQVADDPADQTPPSGPIVDDFPDTKAAAHSLVLDSSGSAAISGTIKSPLDNTDDVDWFQFVAKRTGLLTVDMSTPNSSLDTHLRLHNSTVLLAQDHDRVEINATAGETYWLQVRSGSDAGSSDIRPGFDRTGKYTVRISQPTSVAGGSGTDTTPGPLPGWGGVRGVTINLDGNGNGSSRGGINDPGQVDWYQIDGAKVGFMQVTVTGVNDDFHTEFVTAFRSNGGGIDTDTGEFDGDATVTFLVAAGERIIVAVSSLRGESTGTYTINVSQPTTAPTDDTPNDAANARDMSGELTPEGTGFIRRKIETPTDVDWFKIPVQGTGYMTTQVIPADGSSLPPKLELFRSSSFTTPFLTDDGLDGNTQISFVPAGSDDFIWAKVSSPSGNTGGYSLRTWRTDDPADDHPNASGPYGIPYTVTPQGSVTMSGEIGTAFDQDSFRILVQNPGLMMIDVISLTPGFTPFIHAAWQTPDHQGNSDTDGGSGRGGRAHLEIPSVMASPDNWINLDVRHPDGQTTKGQYLIRAWQPGSTADLDVNSIGPFATPIPVDSTGNGQLGVNLTDANAPAIDFTGDKDVFQVAAATGRPITFTVDSSAIANGTFLRVYDASGNAVATDNNSDPNGKSQITVDAKRGDLYYLEVSAFDGASLGKYTISTSQPTDDHPDAAVFGNQPGPAIPGVMPEVRRGCREPVLLEWCFGTLEGRGELGCDGCEC